MATCLGSWLATLGIKEAASGKRQLFENQAKSRPPSRGNANSKLTMSTDQEPEIPPELELLMAQELAVALVAKHVGFGVEAFEVQWSGGCCTPRALSSVSGIHLLTSDAPEQRRAYIEKRIAVLCARAYATMLVLARKAKVDGRSLTGNEFWQNLDDNGDRSRVVELCAAYLIEDTDKHGSGDRESDFSVRQNQYIFRLGPHVLATLLTETEFLSFVGQSLSDFARSTALFQTTISVELLESYKPGRPAQESRDGERSAEQPCDLPTDSSVPRRVRAEGEDDVSRRCLVAHELGHWLAARYVEIPTRGVKFNLEECGGSCTVFLGFPAFNWPLERYLSARIAVLCAGAFADCWVRSPNKRHGIGDPFYMTLHRGTGVDDFAKLQELYLLYRTMQPSPAESPNLASPPSHTEILAALISLLRKFGLYKAVGSPEFEELAKHVLCMAHLSSNALPKASGQWVEFETAELEAACSAHALSQDDKQTTPL